MNTTRLSTETSRVHGHNTDKKLCRHDLPKKHAKTILYRCRCGNVWIDGVFQGSIPQDQGAVSIFGAFSRGPARPT